MKWGTAFSVTNDGVLLTCASYLYNLENCSFEARRLDMEGFMSSVDIININNSWDLLLLKVNGVNDIQFGDLATDGSLHEGSILLSISNPSKFERTFGLTHVMFPCVEDVILPNSLETKMTCSNYDNYPHAIDRTPAYRIMGHIWNKSTLDDSRSYYGMLHPMIPIIQFGNLCVGVGSSGGPLFNVRGEVVGMIAYDVSYSMYGVHVTLIREYLREHL